MANVQNLGDAPVINKASNIDDWPLKNKMTEIGPEVGSISVVILIRTDTTLDHSQKAEKVCKMSVFA